MNPLEPPYIKHPPTSIFISTKSKNRVKVKSLLQCLILILWVVCSFLCIYIHSTFLPPSELVVLVDEQHPPPRLEKTTVKQRNKIHLSHCEDDDGSSMYYYLYVHNNHSKKKNHSPLSWDKVSVSKNNKFKRNQSTKQNSKAERKLAEQPTNKDCIINPSEIIIESGYSGIHPTRLGSIHISNYNPSMYQNYSVFSKDNDDEEEDFLFHPGNLSMDFVMVRYHSII